MGDKRVADRSAKKHIIAIWTERAQQALNEEGEEDKNNEDEKGWRENLSLQGCVMMNRDTGDKKRCVLGSYWTSTPEGFIRNYGKSRGQASWKIAMEVKTDEEGDRIMVKPEKKRNESEDEEERSGSETDQVEEGDDKDLEDLYREIGRCKDESVEETVLKAARLTYNVSAGKDARKYVNEKELEQREKRADTRSQITEAWEQIREIFEIDHDTKQVHNGKDEKADSANAPHQLRASNSGG